MRSKADSSRIVAVDDSRKFQRMDGFGASLTDTSAWLIAKTLTPEQRTRLLRDLFDPKSGIGLSYLRQPIGTSDFRTREYTCDDVPAGQTDYSLAHFSIEKDKEYILPLLRQIRSINPRLKIMASPWSAPEWMQANHHLKNEEAVYRTYADYFVRFVQAYAAEGVPVEAVTLQNEPQNVQNGYHTMAMEPEEQARLAILLGKRFRAAGIRTKIIIWDHNWDHPEFPLKVLSDPDARAYIEGVAFHGYGGQVSAQSKVHDAYPDKSLYFTECSGGDWAKEFAGNLMWDLENLVVGAPRNWARTVLKWNLALDEKNGPKLPGGADNCRGVVTIHQKTGEVTREVEYYALGHAARFVQPGARRIASEPAESAAYLNPDGSVALIVYNKSRQAQNYTLQWHGKEFASTLPGQSVATFTWPAKSAASAAMWLTTGDQKQLLARQGDLRFH